MKLLCDFSIPGEMTFEDWMALGHMLKGADEQLKWYKADWLAYGCNRFGAKAEAAREVLAISPETARKLAKLSRRFKPCRRRHELTIAHHDEVASLSDERQDELLDLAVSEQFSVRQLRVRVTEIRQSAVKVSPAKEGQSRERFINDDLENRPTHVAGSVKSEEGPASDSKEARHTEQRCTPESSYATSGEENNSEDSASSVGNDSSMSDSDRLDLSTQKIRSAQANLGRSFADLANEFSGFSNVTAMYALLCCGDEDIDSVYDVVFAYVLNVSDKEKNRVVELLLCALSAVMCFDAEQGGIELLEALVDLVLHNVDEWGRNMRESAVARVEGYGFDDLELEQSLINDFLHRVANLFSDAISVENFAEIAPQNAKRVNCT